MFALIFQNKVVQIKAEPFLVASTLTWVDIDGVKPAPEVDWLFDGSKFTAPPIPSIKVQAVAELPTLEKDILYAVVQQAVGEITKEQLNEKWLELKAKSAEAKS